MSHYGWYAHLIIMPRWAEPRGIQCLSELDGIRFLN